MRRSLFLAVLLLFLAACVPLSPEATLPLDRPWLPGDMRLLQPPAGKADLDIIAGYARVSGPVLEVRLDFLDLLPKQRFDLYLAIDSQPGGERMLPLGSPAAFDWDLLAAYPADGSAQIARANGSRLPVPMARLEIDPQLDTIVARFNRSALDMTTRKLSIQAFVTRPASHALISETAPFRLEGAPPGRAPLLLAFWDALPAATPAQALRRWNGAHTGPNGSRHGLFQLLDASAQTGVPVALLDLKTPVTLAALDDLGGLSQVRNLEDRGLLLLPDVVSGDPQSAVESLASSRAAGLRFGLPPSPVLFGPAGLPLPDGYHAAFTTAASGSILQVQKARLIPLPTRSEMDAQQVSADRLSVGLRESLLNEALSSAPRLTVLGGSLPASSWGDEAAALPAMQYIAGHPWIEVLDRDELLDRPAAPAAQVALPRGCGDLTCSPGLPNSTPSYPGLDLNTLRGELRSGMARMAPGPLRDLAWQSYFTLTTPSSDPERMILESNYLGQVAYYLRADEWLRKPGRIGSCSADLDSDSASECMLANDRFFAIFKPEDASLVFAAWNGPTGPEILTGTTALLATGLGDRSEWQLNRALSSDPEVIPGAFFDDPAPSQPYQADVQAEKVTFSNPDGRVKTYLLQRDGITARYHGPAIRLGAVLTLSPQSRWQPENPGYCLSNRTDGKTVSWGLVGNSRVEISSSLPASVSTFEDSASWMRAPEDPDRAYPPGHFLPYPAAQLEWTVKGEAGVELRADTWGLLFCVML